MNKYTANKFQSTHTNDIISLSAKSETEEQHSYDKMLPLAMALANADVMQVNLDPVTICPVIVAVAKRLTEDRELLEKLPDFDITTLDTLRRSSFALSQAHASYLIATAPSDVLPTLAERGTTVLTKFEAWVPGLSLLGLVDAARFTGLRSPVGYRDLVVCLNAYRTAFQEGDWAAIKHKSGLTDEDLADAGAIAVRITELVGQRDINPEKIAAMADVRSRMFTLVMQRYDQMRRAAVYLRWNTGDADALVPSLYVHGPHKPGNQPATDAQPGAPGAASATPATIVGHPANAPATPAGAPATPVTPHAASPASQEVGMPGSSPFSAS